MTFIYYFTNYLHVPQKNAITMNTLGGRDLGHMSNGYNLNPFKI